MMSRVATKVDKRGYASIAEQSDVEKRAFRKTGGILVIAAVFILIGLLYGWQLHNQSMELAELRNQLTKNEERIEELTQIVEDHHDEVVGHNETQPLRRTERSLQEAFIGAHLVGIRGRNSRLCSIDRTICDNMQMPETGDFFVWSSDSSSTFPPIRIDVIDLESPIGTFIKIRAKGYYYVYSQVTYWSAGLRSTGHETVKFRDFTEYNVLMTSIATQKLGTAHQNSQHRRRSLDSGYHGGVFYLYENDKIGVRPVNSNVRTERFFTEKSKAYFGAYFLHM